MVKPVLPKLLLQLVMTGIVSEDTLRAPTPFRHGV